MVNPQHKKDITKRITSITGITREDASKADMFPKVAKSFIDWIGNDHSPKFFCYGNNDQKFLKKTVQYYSGNKVVKQFFNLIYSNLFDFSEDVKKYYKLTNPVKLIYLYNHLYNKNDDQNHNALEDAIMLKSSFYSLFNDPPEPNPFPTYAIPEEQACLYVLTDEYGDIYEFSSKSKAAQWLINHHYAFECERDVRRRISEAILDQKSLFGCSIIQKILEKGE